MKHSLLSQWHLMRIIRLIFGIFLVFQAFETRQWLFIGFAAFFLFQALFNYGCGINNCEISQEKQKNE